MVTILLAAILLVLLFGPNVFSDMLEALGDLAIGLCKAGAACVAGVALVLIIVELFRVHVLLGTVRLALLLSVPLWALARLAVRSIRSDHPAMPSRQAEPSVAHAAEIDREFEAWFSERQSR